MLDILIQHLESLIAFVTGGGLVTLFTLKGKRRKVNAEAEEKEINNWMQQLNRYEKRLQERDAKVDALYIDLRQEQEAKLDQIERNNALELKLELLLIQKCTVRGCQNRIPPSEEY